MLLRNKNWHFLSWAIKEKPLTRFSIYYHAIIKSRRNLYTSCTQKKNVNIVKNIIQSSKVHKGVTGYYQFTASRKCFLVQKNIFHGQRLGVSQICHYHCAVRNPAHGSGLKLLVSTRNPYLFTIPQRHMSLEWLDSLAVTQASWFKALAQSRLVENLMEGLQVIHDYSHLPWWSSIIFSTILMRSTLTFPLSLYQVRVSVITSLIRSLNDSHKIYR